MLLTCVSAGARRETWDDGAGQVRRSPETSVDGNLVLQLLLRRGRVQCFFSPYNGSGIISYQRCAQ